MFNLTFGAGYRAGKAPRQWQERPDGTKVLVQPICPFRGRLQFIQRALWETGLYEGTVDRMAQTTEARHD